jgi:hypothetical protein
MCCFMLLFLLGHALTLHDKRHQLTVGLNQAIMAVKYNLRSSLQF